MLPKPVLIMAGGTGGHIYPALAVADYLQQQGVRILWLGSASGLESRIVPEKGYQLEQIDVRGIRGKGLQKTLFAPFMLMHALLQAIRIMIRLRPAAVLGMGGFVSGPGGIAAWLLRIPLFIHEQNSIAGMTNRILAPMARIVMQGFPGTFKVGKHLRTTGNPVRNDLINLPPVRSRMGGRNTDTMHLLILGGSQGAKVLNDMVPAALKHLPGKADIRIWHQTGERHYERTRAGYTGFPDDNRIRIVPYIEDMAEAYNWADLVLCRAGALTIAELCVVGVASILVPYPYAVDDHQTSNARHLVEKGCAVLIPESDLEEKNLAAILNDFLVLRERLTDMAQKARELACPQATELVADICLEAVNA